MNTAHNKQVFERALKLYQSDDPDGAVILCREVLAASPDDVDFLTLFGASLMSLGLAQDALEPLERAVAIAPGFAIAREHLSQTCVALRRYDEAIEHLQIAVRLEPRVELRRMQLAHALALAGRGEEADAVYEEAFSLLPEGRRLAEAAEHLRAGRARDCEAICRELIGKNADDINALRMLAKVAGEAGRWGHAERLLRRVLRLAPDFIDARLDLARVRNQQDQIEDAVGCAAEAVARAPRNAFAHYLHASMLAIALRYDDAVAAYHRSLELRSYNPVAHVGLGHLLKTLGRQEEGIAAYRAAIAERPNFGEVYWSLANLKTFRFSDAEIADMERRLIEEPLGEDARVHFLFTLGKAWEDQREFERAFNCYAEAAALQRKRISYDPVETEVVHERIRATFSVGFLAERAGQGCEDASPIFIVGLPRSGSTLIEQILASHSQVEGTAELPDVARVISSLAGRRQRETYPEAVQRLDADEVRALGEMYIERTRRHRHGLPFFTDKMPNNFPSIGLIHLMLPNAKIIDARRHPLDSCFGSFKQHFAAGQSFSYDLIELGEFYLEYRRMMRHWQQVLPGRVLEIRYENMVRDQAGETRRLLEHCGLPWEDACLRYHETQRAVRTASSEQVRQPIYDTSLNHWRNFRSHLAPLIEVLGNELDGWDA